MGLAGPTAHRLTIVVGLEEHLEEAEAAPSEVQKHIANAPALRAFVDKIHVGLGSQTKTWRAVRGLDGCLTSLVTATPNKCGCNPSHSCAPAWAPKNTVTFGLRQGLAENSLGSPPPP